MNKLNKIFAALGAGFILASPTQASEAIDASPVVQVVCDASAGSAVRIDSDVYITAVHVLQGKGCKVAGTPVEVLQAGQHDFAIFRGPAGTGVAKYSCGGFDANVEYLAVGYGHAWPVLMYQPLRASAFKIANDPYQMFTGEVIPGMSGGAVFDAKGKVTGLVTMRWPARSIPLSETSLCKKGI